MLFSKEHYELMAQFEKEFSHHRLGRESKEMWKTGAVYQNGMANELFMAYRKGHSYARSVSNLEAA